MPRYKEHKPFQQIERREQTLNRLGITELKDGYGGTYYRANKEQHTAPEIIGEYFEDGVRMYEVQGGRVFIASAYDKAFLPANQKKPVFKAQTAGKTSRKVKH